MQILKSFIRNFYFNRLYTLLNIIGLAVGLAAFTFILLYIFDEQSFDKYHLNHKQIYRIDSDITISGKQQHVSKSSYAIGPALLREVPEVEDFVRFRLIDHCYLKAGDNKFYEPDIFYTDASVFNIFTHSFLAGDPESALTDPYSIVLTESLSIKYFGTTDVINKIVYLKNRVPCKVTGVIDDLPHQSHLYFSGLISMPTIKTELGEEMYSDLENIHFWALRLFTYIKIREGSSIESVHIQFPAVHDKYIAPVSERMNGVYNILTTRLDRIHLHNCNEWDLPKGNANTVYALYAVAIFILLIAGINYMNLATARSAQKAKEVGMRKVLGAYRQNLSRYYIADAVLVSLAALIISIVIVELILPFFNQITHKSLSFEFRNNLIIYFILILASMFIGFLSGLYPAYYLASFQASGVFSKVRTMGPTGGILRKVLIVFQFSVATAMIAVSIIITFQVNYLQHRDLGFVKENLLVVRATDTSFKKQFEAFKHDISKNPEVINLVTTNILPGIGNYLDIFLVENKEGTDKQLMSFMFVSENFIEALGLKVINGRSFHNYSEEDKLTAAIINKTAAVKLGWFDDAPGKKILRRGYEREEFKVVGVIDDLVYSSLYEKMGPIVVFLEDYPGDLLCIRITNHNQKATLQQITKVWNDYNPNEPFKYDFLTDLLDEIYINEFKLNNVVISFAFLALFISLLGLFGLTSYITEKSSKNIGIRKIMGASTYNIMALFLKNFSSLIFIAILISTPLVWFTMNKWLDHFAYRVEMKISWFVISGLLVLFVAQLTVISQTIKSAFSNPIDSIRHD